MVLYDVGPHATSDECSECGKSLYQFRLTKLKENRLKTVAKLKLPVFPFRFAHGFHFKCTFREATSSIRIILISLNGNHIGHLSLFAHENPFLRLFCLCVAYMDYYIRFGCPVRAKGKPIAMPTTTMTIIFGLLLSRLVHVANAQSKCYYY